MRTPAGSQRREDIQHVVYPLSLVQSLVLSDEVQLVCGVGTEALSSGEGSRLGEGGRSSLKLCVHWTVTRNTLESANLTEERLNTSVYEY